MHPTNPTVLDRPPVFSARPGIFDLFSGLALPFRGARLLVRSPALRKWSALSALLAALAIAAVVLALIYGVAPGFAHLWPEPAGTGGRILWNLTKWAALLVGFTLGVLTLPALALVPLEEPISEATEAALGLPPLERTRGQVTRALWIGLGHTLFRLGVLWTGHLLLLLLLLAAPLAPAWPPLSTLWTALFLAAEYCDIPITRRLLPPGALGKLLWRRRWLCLGFGLILSVLFWIPVVNLLFVPLAIVSGTLLRAGVETAGG